MLDSRSLTGSSGEWCFSPIELVRGATLLDWTGLVWSGRVAEVSLPRGMAKVFAQYSLTGKQRTKIRCHEADFKLGWHSQARDAEREF